ncbi:DUF1353 domain-containing protein [Zooshikella marina]|uniref:DUF1353 domain-containing protein n=1 Tax=Zooshikella ganghwensis TaxID=202772 RepID=UPI001BAF5678|nr:DUF1353 domain-containing protein [Zooshikella ganghwensis]MBU2708890.1 DUF1353 domain-containing protein [Zooshikella ganghwensis]
MFLNRLEVQHLPTSNQWKVQKELTYKDTKRDFGLLTVPVDFITDFASIPRIFWMLLPRDGKYLEAAVLHDWLYFRQPDEMTRKEADLIFRDAMNSLDVASWKSALIYYAVRLFGRAAFNEYKRLFDDV